MIVEIDKTLDEIKDIRDSFYSCTFEDDENSCRDCMYKNYDFPDCQNSLQSNIRKLLNQIVKTGWK